MRRWFVLLVDESSAMQAPAAPEEGRRTTEVKSTIQNIATALNSLLTRVSATDELEIALVGYQMSSQGVNVGCRWGGLLANRRFVNARELGSCPIIVESRTRKTPSGEVSVDFPIWYQPQLGEGAPQAAAFKFCRELLTERPELLGDTEAPLVLHVFSASSCDGDPSEAITEIARMDSFAGTPLVLHAHIATSSALSPTLYPSNRATLAGNTLDWYDRAALLPEWAKVRLRKSSLMVGEKARGLIYNARMPDLFRLITLVTTFAGVEDKAPVRIVPTSSPEQTSEDEPKVPSEEQREKEQSVELTQDRDALVPPPVLGDVTPDQPALVLFLFDRSVADPGGDNSRNACVRLQDRLGEMLETIAKFELGVIDVGIISYGANENGETEVRSALEGSFSGRSFVRDNELTGGKVKFHTMVEERSNGIGGINRIEHSWPVLVEVTPSRTGDVSTAFAEAERLVSEWLTEHSSSSTSPMVVHLTRGQADPDDVRRAVSLLGSIRTSSGGPTAVYHVLETETPHASLICPSAYDGEGSFMDNYFQLSSLLMGWEEIAKIKPRIDEKSRGFSVNDRATLLLSGIKAAANS